MQCEATALLVLEMLTEHGHGITPVKVFEYLGAARPILSLGSRESAIGRLIAESHELVLRGWLDEFEQTGTFAYAVDEA